MFDEVVKHSANIRLHNRKRILNQLRFSGKTKKQLADALNLSIATASNLCNTLIQDGFLVSNSTNSSDGGRIPQCFMLKETARFVVCLNVVERDIITIALTDLMGTLLYQDHIDSRKCTTPDQLMEFSAECIKDMLSTNGIACEQLIGIGVAVSGNELGVSCTIQNSSGNPLLEGASIRETLGAIFPQTSVFIENEANEAVLALNYEHPSLNDLVYLYIGDGVGVGIISDGHLIRGYHGLGSEINHIQLGSHGYTCYCGQRDCIETEMSIVGFQRKYFELSGIEHSFNRYGWDLFEAAVRSNTESALHVIEENGRMIGRTISLLSQLFDAPDYWVGGFDSYIYSRLYPFINEEVNERSIFKGLLEYHVHFDEGFHSIITKGCYELVFQNWLP